MILLLGCAICEVVWTTGRILEEGDSELVTTSLPLHQWYCVLMQVRTPLVLGVISIIISTVDKIESLDAFLSSFYEIVLFMRLGLLCQRLQAYSPRAPQYLRDLPLAQAILQLNHQDPENARGSFRSKTKYNRTERTLTPMFAPLSRRVFTTSVKPRSAAK